MSGVEDGGTRAADPADLLSLAETVAREAGELVVRMRRDGMAVADTKTSPTDVVTAADKACEELVRDRLLAARPEDGMLGEEGLDVAGTSGVRWVIDPIDGTVNYLYGSRDYAVSIAAQVDGESVAGVVHQPVLGISFTASRGGGSHLDGVPLAVRDVVPLSESLVHTGFSYRAEVRARQGAALAQLLPRIGNLRRPGSCALDICAVAAGRADAYMEEGAHLWDHAAASLVLSEAGGRFGVYPGASELELVVAAPADGFDAFLALLRECGFLGQLHG